MRDVEYRAGVHLGGTILWCDAGTGRSLCFLSRFGVRLPDRARGLLTTETTRALLAARAARGTRLAALVSGALAAPYGRPFGLGAMRLELVPAGLVPGAALLYVVRSDGRRVLYAAAAVPGAPTRLAPPCEPRASDALVIEAALDPAHDLPPATEEIERLVAFCDEAAGRGAIVVARSPAVALDLVAAIGARHPVALDARHAAWARACRRAHVALPAHRVHRGGAAPPGTVWIRSDRRGVADAPRTAVVDAAGPRAVRSFRLAAGADAATLIGFAADCRAHDVYVTGTHAAALAARLTAKGFATHLVGPPHQLQLL